MDYLQIGATVFVSVLALIYLYSKWQYSYWKRKGVPQLEPEFFYGNTRDMVNGEKSIADTFLDVYKKFRATGAKYGGVYVVFRHSFVPIAPELIKDILQKNFDHFTAHFPKFGQGVFTKSLFHLEGKIFYIIF